MSAVEAVRAAHAAGVTVAVDGEALLLEAASEPPESVLRALARHKRDILDLLRRGDHRSGLEQSHASFNEGCGTAAENSSERTGLHDLALERRVVEWLNLHPSPSPAGCCAGCGRSESPSAEVVPFGTEPGMHTWLHPECWRAWHEARRAEAIAAVHVFSEPRGTHT